MVAAAKLRRAQEAGEAGASVRRRAWRRDARQPRCAARAAGGGAAAARRHRPGRRAPARRHDRRPRPRAAASTPTSSSRRAPRSCLRRQTARPVKILRGRPQGLGQLLPRSATPMIVGDVDRPAEALGSAEAAGIADEITERVRRRRVRRRRHWLYARSSRRSTQMPTAMQLIPCRCRRGRRRSSACEARLRSTSPTQKRSLGDAAAALPRRCRSVRACWRPTPASEQARSMTAMDSATRNAGDMIKHADAAATTARARPASPRN